MNYNVFDRLKILFDLINKKAKNQHKVFEAELIIRESTSELSR